jgi:hypothetical protein
VYRAQFANESWIFRTLQTSVPGDSLPLNCCFGFFTFPGGMAGMEYWNMEVVMSIV